jgi:hypothetical protein
VSGNWEPRNCLQNCNSQLEEILFIQLEDPDILALRDWKSKVEMRAQKLIEATLGKVTLIFFLHVHNQIEFVTQESTR